MEKEYSIPIVWQSYKRYKVKANSLQEAAEIAIKQFLSEPDETYIEDSFEVDEIIHDEYPGEDFSQFKLDQSL
jgi:hypothetical protein